MALLAVMCSIMQKRQWEGQELADAKIADIPIGFGPYVITKYDAGRSVQLTRNKMYWGSDANLPLHRGTNNFDQIIWTSAATLPRNTTPSKLAKYPHNANLTLNAGIAAMMSHLPLLVMLYNRNSRTKSHQV